MDTLWNSELSDRRDRLKILAHCLDLILGRVQDADGRRKSIWAFNSSSLVSEGDGFHESLEVGLCLLLERLESKKDILHANFEGWEMMLWCGHFQSSFDGGPTFSPRVLRVLGDFGVQLFLDNYFSENV